MSTKHDHIRTEMSAILANIAGLTIVTAQVGSQEAARPFARLWNVGERVSGLGESNSKTVSTVLMLELGIEHEGGVEGLAEERNRLAQAVEHVCDLYTMSDYTDAQYACTDFVHEYQGASGVVDSNGARAMFSVTISIEYVQTPII